MLEVVFYLALIETLGVLIVVFLRQKGFYFRSVQILFIATFSSFALIAFCDLIKNYFLRLESVIPFTTMIGVSAALIGSISVEHAASTLHKGKEISWKIFFRKEHLPSIIFKGYVILLLILTWALTPFQIQLVRDVWGGFVYSPVYESWYLISLFVVAIAIIAYPSRLLVLSSRKFKEKEVASALKWFGVCWVGISFALIYFHGFVLSYLKIEMVAIEYVFIASFFGVITHFFGKTTILESFFEKPYPSISVSEGESVLLTYAPQAHKMKTFSAFIREGIVDDDLIAYIYPDEESDSVRSRLATYGIDVDKYEKDGTLFMKSLSEFFMPEGNFDKEGPIQFLLNRRTEAKKKGCKAREIEDVGDFSFLKGQWQLYLEYWNDLRWDDPKFAKLKEPVGQVYKPFIMELTAVNLGGMTEPQVTELLEAFGRGSTVPTKVIDQIARADTFSKALGLTRQELVGRTVLFEFDPASDYEKPVADFIDEALANVEPVTLFTRKGSIIYSALSDRGAIKILLLTQRISAPRVDNSTNEMLLPANNTPLLLDALEKMLKTSSSGSLNIVFDSLSSLILLVGFKKTYNFVRYTLDMLASENSTALFLFSLDTHDQRVTSSLRSLFSNHLSYKDGSLQIVKLPESKLKDTEKRKLRDNNGSQK